MAKGIWARCVSHTNGVRPSPNPTVDFRLVPVSGRAYAIGVGDHDGPVEIAIRRADPKRTISQFSILNATARQLAESTGHTIEEVKAQALVSCFGADKLKRFEVLGREIFLPMSTNELSKEEASRVIDWLVKMAEVVGCKLLAPHEYEYM